MPNDIMANKAWNVLFRASHPVSRSLHCSDYKKVVYWVTLYIQLVVYVSRNALGLCKKSIVSFDVVPR
jgi:hypothetical protein